MPKTSSLERRSPGDERTSLTGQGAISDELDENGKRKLPPKHTGTRFKAVGNMVLAMRRFQASLNPTVTFGKPSSSAGGSVSSGGTADAEATSEPRGPQGRGGPLDAANRGKLQRVNTPTNRNRMALIMQKLPDPVET